MVAPAELLDLELESGNWPRRMPLFGIQLDAVTLPEAVSLLTHWLRDPFECCRFVVTPNVDHVVLLEEQPRLRAAYADASLVLADGWPVVAASRCLGRALPARVAGSDLVPALLGDERLRDLRVFLLGAAPGVAERAGDRIQQRWPRTSVVGTYSPPLGFEDNAGENERILRMIAHSEPDLLVVGLGAPKQELWVHAHQGRIRAKVAICAGATIDFLAGEKRRAPRWMQRSGLEWLHRMVTEPRRMVRRYARDAVVFPQIVARQAWQLRTRRSQTAERAACRT